MFDYKLKGKQVILSLDEEFIPYLKQYGIQGTPLFAKVHRMEDNGLWLESENFTLCPKGIPKLYRPTGEAFCRAHIFIPSKAIVTLVAFPGDVSHLQKDPKLHKIGFRVRRRTPSQRKSPRKKTPRPGPRKRVNLPGSHSRP